MTKVIIKPIIHLSDEGMKAFYNFINDQYQKNDFVIVPYYCEVYVVDGDPELKVKKSSADCDKQEAKDDSFRVTFDGKSADEWFKHDMCIHCKHSYDDGCCGLGEPCSDFNRWEYKNND